MTKMTPCSIIFIFACQLLVTNCKSTTAIENERSSLAKEHRQQEMINGLQKELENLKEEFKAHVNTLQKELVDVKEELKQFKKTHAQTQVPRVASSVEDSQPQKRQLNNQGSCQRGPAGPAGRDGRDGRDGAPGKDGAAGKDGTPGKDGAPGVPAKDGKDGQRGPQGQPGPSLTPENLKTLLDVLNKKQIAGNGNGQTSGKTTLNSQTNGGSVYVRWGRSVCPGDAELLYNGYIGGSYYTQTGNGANYVCLPIKPQWGNFTDGHQSNSYIHGTEYEIYPNDPFSLKNAGDGLKNVHNYDAVCAVCHTPKRSSNVMIPAWRSCPNTWTKEYSGYLMSHHYTQQKSTYICVDEAPEVRKGSRTSTNGALLYHVEVSCDSLPCPDYVNGRELTCAVCSK